jgi:hypothetical protein
MRIFRNKFVLYADCKGKGKADVLTLPFLLVRLIGGLGLFSFFFRLLTIQGYRLSYEAKVGQIVTLWDFSLQFDKFYGT